MGEGKGREESGERTRRVWRCRKRECTKNIPKYRPLWGKRRNGVKWEGRDTGRSAGH